MRLLGKFKEDVSVVNSSSFGSKLGSFVGEPFVVGCDSRFGSLPMKLAANSGLLSSGCNVADLGYVPAPVVARIAREEKVWGIHFSADPYPAEYVGLRIYDSSGRPWDGKIEPKDVQTGIGRLAKIDLTPNYMGELMAKYSPEPLKVVVDSANGPTGQTVPALLRSLGSEVLEVNSSLSPTSTRGYEPSRSNVRDLEFMVRKKRADFGVAFDGSGNKASFVVPGRHISAGRAMALIMKFNGFDRAIADIGATSVLDLVGNVERVPASESKVAERLYARGFEMGGGTTGVAFSDWGFSPDATVLMLELMELVSHEGKSLEEMDNGLPESYEDALLIPVKEPFEAIDKAREEFGQSEMDLREGLKVNFEDGWIWFKPMVDHVRISVESDTRDRMTELKEKAKNSINHVI